ncbi:hypothetical protein BaRGS_00029178, partial [Batillaria attramentaria]
FTRSSTTLAITTGETSEAPGSKQVVNLTVVISVTIAAVAATLITFRFVSVRKGRNNNDIQPEPRVQAVRDEEGQGQDAENTPAYHYYWEIQDDALSEATASDVTAPGRIVKETQCDADGYLIPVKTGNTRSKHSLNKNAYPKRDSNQ